MRRALVRRAPRGMARAVPVTVPAPFGGINGRDPLAAMPASDALDLDNFLAVEGGVETREGYAPVHDLGTAAPVAALLELNDGDPRLVAASGGKLFAVRDTGFAELGLGFASDAWRGAMLDNRLFLVNGADAPRMVMGAALTTPAFTGPADVARLHRVAVFADRLFFAEADSSAFWYGGLNAVQGALGRFDLASVGGRGGVVEEIVAFAPDGGEGGSDDALAFYMSSGQVLVYRGTNPGDAASWSLTGVFTASAPLAVERIGGDVLAVTRDGYGSLMEMLPSGRSPIAGMGQKLGQVALDAVQRYGAGRWQVLHHPARRLVIVHVRQTAMVHEQHVMNAATGAWSRFTGLPASAWGQIGGDLLFGTVDGRICRYGGADDGGRPIVATAQGAWGTLGAPGRIKRVNMVRPIVASVATPIVRHVIGADFRRPGFGATAQLAENARTGVWGASVWDQAVWGGSERVTRAWRGGGTMGDFIAFGLRRDANAGRVTWIATTALVEAGGVLG